MQDQAMILEEPLHESSEPVRMTPFTGPIAWTRASLSPDDGIVKISEACRRELDEVVATLRANPLPTALLRTDDFSLERCREMMREASQLLTDGPGFVIVDRLPMDLWTKQEATAVYWLLAQMVSRPVAQSWDGKMIYDVRDLGKPPGNGVRPDITSAEQNFHTDNSYNICPPDYVALLCLRPAKQGGVSSIVSFYTVYNQMIERYPHLLARLFRPYVFDRQREHAPGDATLISHPLFQNEGGRMVCRLSHRHVIAGYEMADRDMDEETRDALQTLEAVMLEPQWTRDFFFEPGQIQIVDNQRCGHRRTQFVDFDEEDRKRHLVRLWLRDAHRRFYNG
ncbi:Taurine catabolism dioxygenase TauD, TfdA family [Caballeronia calidae]|uniref:Taurine catabolism dioxygenase TauD, TfdA family n=1 Tax=Caballeronia calidae TaxID=1777139 RepID=A0A158E7R8_9BURK|nr:TauD/TfdA family dioxygenase [Caballeronia calidae]SAL02909.1 Taurine catabolism dioxygenase TauD, TfdA family [Caballeronia calidae]